MDELLQIDPSLIMPKIDPVDMPPSIYDVLNAIASSRICRRSNIHDFRAH